MEKSTSNPGLNWILIPKGHRKLTKDLYLIFNKRYSKKIIYLAVLEWIKELDKVPVTEVLEYWGRYDKKPKPNKDGLFFDRSERLSEKRKSKSAKLRLANK